MMPVWISYMSTTAVKLKIMLLLKNIRDGFHIEQLKRSDEIDSKKHFSL
jgi:hypothetical protein